MEFGGRPPRCQSSGATAFSGTDGGSDDRVAGPAAARVAAMGGEIIHLPDLPLALRAGWVIGRERGNEPLDAVPSLEREVRRRRAGEGADVLDGRFARGVELFPKIPLQGFPL